MNGFEEINTSRKNRHLVSHFMSYIDVDDGCWRRIIVLMTFLRCW